MTDVAINTSQCNTFLPNTPESPIALPAITIRQIAEHVAAHYGYTLAQLVGDGRPRPYTLPRRIAMLLAKRILNRSSKVIGRVMRRDHTTVLFGQSWVELRMERNPVLATEVQALELEILALGSVRERVDP